MRKISETNLSIHVASLGARFGHYIIDVIAFYLIFIVIAAFFQGINMFNEDEFPFAIYIIQFSYYTLMEWYFGFTIGKYIIGSIVIDEYGHQLSLSAAAYRSMWIAHATDTTIPYHTYPCISAVLIYSHNIGTAHTYTFTCGSSRAALDL